MFVVLMPILLSAAPAPTVDDPRLPEKEIAELVDQLVSPNVAPTRRGPGMKYPEGFDREAQKRVFEAWQKLRSLGLDAFPAVIKRLDDDRYSFTNDGAWVKENWTVGRACADIICGHLQPFGTLPYARGNKGDSRPFVLRPSYCAEHGLSSPELAAAWWSKNKDKKLLELQIEAIEWTIAEESKSTRFSDDERKYMAEYLKDAQKAEKPLRPSSPFPQ
jgi:hypothetical protein